MQTSLLTSTDSTGHIHLIIGTNSLAASRCAKSLEVGAKPIVIFHQEVSETEIYSSLQQLIQDEKVQWVRKPFHDEDISTLGRFEVDCYVDAVFVTLSPRDPQSASHPPIHSLPAFSH
jgi:uroporphyrin-III C-methyltransferase